MIFQPIIKFSYTSTKVDFFLNKLLSPSHCRNMTALCVLLSFSLHSNALVFLGLAEYEEIKSPVYLGAISLTQKPRNPAHIHTMTGKKQMRFHIQKPGYPLRSFTRHIEKWAIKGNKNNPNANAASKNSILELEKSIKEALNRPFVKRGDILIIDILNSNIRISINGKILLEQRDQNLTDYLLNIWAGQPPADPRFYQELIHTPTQSTHYQELVLKLSLANPNFNESTLTFTATEQVEEIAHPVSLSSSFTAVQEPVVTKKPAVKSPVVETSGVRNTAENHNKNAAPNPEPNTTVDVNKAIVNTSVEKSKVITVGKTYTEAATDTHEAEVIDEEGYSRHLQGLLINAINKSPLPINIQNMPHAVLYISNQGMIYSGEFGITPDASVNISKKERMVLKRSAISLSPVPVTQAMKDKAGLYVVEFSLQP